MSLTQTSRRFLQNRGAYTLVEMLVTVSIFSLAFVTIGAIFAAFYMAQSRASQAQKLLNEANYVFEAIAREVRNNAVDYACSFTFYGSLDNYICLKTQDGRVVHFRYRNSNVQVCKADAAADCADPWGAGSSRWVSLIGSSMTVTRLRFVVQPKIDPRSEYVDAKYLYHPIVRIIMRVEAGGGRAKQTYDLQTAVSQRVF